MLLRILAPAAVLSFIVLVPLRSAQAETCNLPKGEVEIEPMEIPGAVGVPFPVQQAGELGGFELHHFLVPSKDCKSIRYYTVIGKRAAPTDDECKKMEGSDFSSVIGVMFCQNFPVYKTQAEAKKAATPRASFENGVLVTEHASAFAGTSTTTFIKDKGKIKGRMQFNLQAPPSGQATPEQKSAEAAVDLVVKALEDLNTPEGKKIAELTKQNEVLLKFYYQSIYAAQKLQAQKDCPNCALIPDAGVGK